MKMTSDLFEAYLKCPTKCYLRSFGETETENVYADWVRTQNESYRSQGIKRLTEGAASDEIVVGPPGMAEPPIGGHLIRRSHRGFHYAIYPVFWGSLNLFSFDVIY